MIRHVFMDLDDTLLDFHQAEATAIRQTLTLMLGAPPSPEVISRYSAINQQQWELLEEKKITRQQLFLRRFQILYDELGMIRSPEETQSHYARFLSQGHWFMPQAEALLDALYGKYQMYIVSNGTASIQAGRLKSAGISRYFSGIFISETIGVNKPAPEFFRYCFDRIPDFSPGEALILGDSLTSDIREGINAGITTCWYNPTGKPLRGDIVPDHQIRELLELPALLAGL